LFGWLEFNVLFSTNTAISETRDDGVAVASAGPYVNHLHLTPDRQSCQYLSTQFFYRPNTLPTAEPTASKH